MLKVTQAASDYLSEVLERAQAPSEAAVRIVPRDEGSGLVTAIDHERAGNQHFDCDGRTVLVLDRRSRQGCPNRPLTSERTASALSLPEPVPTC